MPGLCLCYYNYAGDACQNYAATYYETACSKECPAFSSHDSSIDYPRFPSISDCVCNPTFTCVGDTCMCPAGFRFYATTSDTARSVPRELSRKQNICRPVLPALQGSTRLLPRPPESAEQRRRLHLLFYRLVFQLWEGQCVCTACVAGKSSDCTAPCVDCAAASSL